MFENIFVKIEDAEGYIDTVEAVTRLGDTNSHAEIRNRLSRLYRPRKDGTYDKVFLEIKTPAGVERCRRDLAPDEATPHTILAELIAYDEKLGESSMTFEKLREFAIENIKQKVDTDEIVKRLKKHMAYTPSGRLREIKHGGTWENPVATIDRADAIVRVAAQKLLNERGA